MIMNEENNIVGVVKPSPLRNNLENSNVVLVSNRKPYTAYSQYAFFRFQEGVEELTFKCCGSSILEGLKSIVTLSSLLRKDVMISDIKLSQHVDKLGNTHTKMEVSVTNPNIIQEEAT